MGLDNLDIFDEGESEEPIELQPEVQVQQCAPQEQLVAQPNKGCQYVAVKGHSRNVRKGKALGVNPRGSFAERRAWNLHMQVKKAQKRMLVCETDALEMLHSLQTRSRERVQIQKGKKGNLFSKKRLVQISYLKAPSGNRFVYKYSMSDFLECSFGVDTKHAKRLTARNHQALAMNAAPSTIAYMRTVVCGSVLSRQCGLLGQLLALCRANPPTAVGLRESFDETVQIVTVNQQKGGYQVCVLRHTLIIAWGSGLLRVPIILPPLLVRSPSAEQLHPEWY